ncbi:hypothetical protein SORBI_3009G113200 [Sorghum bicolor]|uniref:Uncharacterized protein n=1 Tax=Sorghum bicolor TaxID=4558 RepID=A0A1Z5R294_SORBI|nr:hypothetical protein SORBI_3009G113200 [Sorghum bicolor]
MDWQECTYVSFLPLILPEHKPDLSRWTLKYEVLGWDVEFSWLARNMTPIKNQKTNWQCLQGLPNRCCPVFPKNSSSCRVQQQWHMKFLKFWHQLHQY